MTATTAKRPRRGVPTIRRTPGKRPRTGAKSCASWRKCKSSDRGNSVRGFPTVSSRSEVPVWYLHHRRGTQSGTRSSPPRRSHSRCAARVAAENWLRAAWART